MEWLGEVPAHWGVLPNRALFLEVRERDHPDEQMLSVTITKGVILQHDLLSGSSKKDSSRLDRASYKLVQPGDIAYNKMRAWQGAIGASIHRGIVSPAYIVVRPRNHNLPRYFHYLCRTPAFAKEAERWSYGITSDMWSLRPEHFKMIYSSLPPIEEQRAIVRFIDYMDRRIQRYIRAKQRLIKLLNEQKQATIHHAVTRGLDPNVRLKPSGMEWLGDIPEHWNVVLLGRCIRSIEQGWSPMAANGELENDQWAVLSLSSIKRGRFFPHAIKPIPIGSPVPEEITIHDGDFLLTRSNTRDRVGDVCLVDGARTQTILSDLIYRLDIISTIISPQYLMFQLLTPLGRIQIERDARGSSDTMPKISQGHIKSWRVLIPPLREQTEIVNNLIVKCKSIDEAIERAQNEFNLLPEYRARLIADIVTGKLDVRKVAVQLPDEIGEKEVVIEEEALLDEEDIESDGIVDIAEEDEE